MIHKYQSPFDSFSTIYYSQLVSIYTGDALDLILRLYFADNIDI